MRAPRRVILGLGPGAAIDALLRPASELAARLGAPLLIAYGTGPALRELQRLPAGSSWHFPRGAPGLDSPAELERALAAATELARRACCEAADQQGIRAEFQDMDRLHEGLAELVTERDIVLLQRRARSFGAASLSDTGVVALAARLRGAVLLPGARGFWPGAPLPAGMLERPVTLAGDGPEDEVLTLLQAWLPRVALRVRRLPLDQIMEGAPLAAASTLVVRRAELLRLEERRRKVLNREELSVLVV